MRNKKLIVITIAVLLIVSIFLIIRVLTVKHIVIIGNKNLAEKEIKDALGIKEGNSIIYPSAHKLYERLKKIPWVKEAIIRKDLNGTLTVYIKEATAVAIAVAGERAYLIDNEAHVLEDFTEKLKHTQIFLPIIKEIDPFKDKSTLQSAVELINFLTAKGYTRSNDEIVITGSDPDNLTLHLNNLKIIIGNGDFELKFAKYLVVNDEIQKRGLNVHYIDLRFPDRVIVKPAE